MHILNCTWHRLVLGLAMLLLIRVGHAQGYPNTIDQDEDEGLMGGYSPPGVAYPSFYISEPYVNAWVYGQPLAYATSGGRLMALQLSKKYAEPVQHGDFTFGGGWDCNWLSHVEFQGSITNPAAVTVQRMFVSLGGVRYYTPDGTTLEQKSRSWMSKITNGSGNLSGFAVDYPNGARDLYDYLDTGDGNAYLSQSISADGRTNVLNYDTIANIVRLRTVVDSDGRTNTISYDPTLTTRISSIQTPYGQTVSLSKSYETEYVTYPLGESVSVTRDISGTNGYQIYMPYGYVRTDFGGTYYGPSRQITLIHPDGGNELFLFRDHSQVYSNSNFVDLYPGSYPTNEVPTTSPFTNTFNNTEMSSRISFHWDQAAYASLSTNFQSSGVSYLTTNDYKLAHMKHWLRKYNNTNVVSQVISMERLPSPDGTNYGQAQWYDYAGKANVGGGNWGSRGTNDEPSLVALVLPDGTSRFSYFQRNPLGYPTNIVSTYSSNGVVSIRTNSFVFATNNMDLLEARGPLGELMSSNAYNSYHQVVTNFNAANDKMVFTYESSHRLTGALFPSGLVTTNYFYTTGTNLGWLEKTMEYDAATGSAYRTNSFTYTNGVVETHTNPRGVTITNSWDVLFRLTKVSSPLGSVVNTYTNLDLIGATDPLGNTNGFLYNNMDQMTQATDARGYSQTYDYCGCGALTAATDALSQSLGFEYDFNKNRTSTTLPDGNVIEFKYNLVGQNTVVMQPANCTTNYFNNQGLQIGSSNCLGRLSLTSYDIRDRVITNEGPNGVVTSMVYDNADRVLMQTYPDGGVEQFQYSALGLIATTNQLGKVTTFGYDSAGRKIAETNANSEVTRYGYDCANAMTMLIDAKNQTNRWEYDPYGRCTNQIDAAGNSIFTFKYDALGRMTNRWTPAKGHVYFAYDRTGNLTNCDYAASTDLRFKYDALGRPTNMVDAAGTTSYAYTVNGNLFTEDGPWDSDTVTNFYNDNGLRSGLAMQIPYGSPWIQTYLYDDVARLTNIVSPAGSFSYDYVPGVSSATSVSTLIRKISFPNGSYITNTFDGNSRLLSTKLRNNAHVDLNSHSYSNNVANQRVKQTRLDGSYVDYTYDSIGQLKTGTGKESGGSTRKNENFAYGYDAAGNLAFRTNNALVQSWTVDSLNQLSAMAPSGTFTVKGIASASATNVTVNGSAASRYADNTFALDGLSLSTTNLTAIAVDAYGRTDTNSVSILGTTNVAFVYDTNGNMTSDGRRGLDYDDENQLIRVTVTNDWKSEFTYDARRRRRVRKEYGWINSSWVQTAEVRYVYDGMLIAQERDGSNVPLVSYTRGLDLSGSGQGAGGIGGLLARTDRTTSSGHAYYHCDGNGNVTMLLDERQKPVAQYLYDPYGNILAKSGPLAEANLYRFSSKEWHLNSGLVYYGYRYYEPNLQRWVNRDPIGHGGGNNLYQIAGNSANSMDAFGLFKITPVLSRNLGKGFSGKTHPPQMTKTFASSFETVLVDPNHPELGWTTRIVIPSDLNEFQFTVQIQLSVPGSFGRVTGDLFYVYSWFGDFPSYSTNATLVVGASGLNQVLSHEMQHFRDYRTVYEYAYGYFEKAMDKVTATFGASDIDSMLAMANQTAPIYAEFGNRLGHIDLLNTYYANKADWNTYSSFQVGGGRNAAVYTYMGIETFDPMWNGNTIKMGKMVYFRAHPELRNEPKFPKLNRPFW